MNTYIRSVLSLLVMCMGSLPALAQDSATETYRSKCAMCHGTDGMANTPMGKVAKAPSFKSPDLLNATDTDLGDAVKNGNGKMAAYSDRLTDAQINDLIAYIRTLQK